MPQYKIIHGSSQINSNTINPRGLTCTPQTTIISSYVERRQIMPRVAKIKEVNIMTCLKQNSV